MKCEQVQERFPELQEDPERYPELMRHIEACAECRQLYELFLKLQPAEMPGLSDEQRELNCRGIYKKMFRHDLFVVSGRVGAAAAVFLLVLFSVFSLNTGSAPSLADIPDDVLYLESQSEIIPEPAMDEESMIEYLVYNEYIEELGNIY